MKNSQKGLIVPLLIVIIVMLIIGGGIYIWEKSQIAPSIKITSPGSENSWITGSTHTISWTTKNISATSKISITLRRVPPPPLQIEGQEFDPIVFINLENNGTTSWSISDMYPTGTYIMGISAYSSIPITNPISAESASFKIIHF